MINIRCRQHDHGLSIGFAIFDTDASGKPINACQKVTLEVLETEWDVIPDCISIDRRHGENALQRLMDDLWDCGIRPSAAAGSAGQLAAVQAHLSDVQMQLQARSMEHGDAQETVAKVLLGLVERLPSLSTP